ncbi:MAG: hypothetical protein JW750_07760 [Anaerolineaceae bacterium]|nr:hypothetical protein [Anaerolineaceae bacterium]
MFQLTAKKRLAGSIGQKAEKLAWLRRKGFTIPPSWVVSWHAYDRQQSDPDQLRRELCREMEKVLEPDQLYAVRSSANIEDAREDSFAGQFLSVLNVSGIEGVFNAVKSIWHQAYQTGVDPYLDRKQLNNEGLKMGVVIQPMISARAAGVAFSRNPVTGLDEVIVEAVEGSGEKLVQDGVTPLRWVQKWGAWLEAPGNQPAVMQSVIEEVVSGVKEIARTFGKPVDLEWAWDGQTLYWLQLREITTLDVPIYSNRISKEVFPGIIKPLIWSVNVPLVNGAWVKLFGEMINLHTIDPMDLAGIFFHRAYFNMSTLGDVFELLGISRETLELLLGLEVEGPEKPGFRPSKKTWLLLPRLIWFLYRRRHYARDAEEALRQLEQRYREFSRHAFSSMNLKQLMELTGSHFDAVQTGAYYNITLPLLMYAFNGSLRSQLKKCGIDYQSLDLYADMPVLDRFDPLVHIDRLHQLFRQEQRGLLDELRRNDFSYFQSLQGIEPLQTAVDDFLEQFGHFSDSGNDFSVKPWRENPDLVLKMILDHSSSPGGSKHLKQLEEMKIPFHKRWLVRKLVERSRNYHYLRQWVSSIYTLGYGYFRDLYREIATRLRQQRLLRAVDDIFYLERSEIDLLIDGQLSAAEANNRAARRREEIEIARDLIPPEIIYGDQPLPMFAAEGRHLKGIPTSRGVYTGRVKVLLKVEDMGKVAEGDVLVVPYSDVGWTPVFARAGAVVAESGGILSHSSIIAREYKIPAVVSVNGACQLADDVVVTVDAFRGEIIVHLEGE